MIKLNFFVKSNNWPKRLNKIKKITNKVIKQKSNLNFEKNIDYYLNIILLNDKKIKKLNLQYNKINKSTDVLTFVSKFQNVNFIKTKYCDIFFSAETILFDSKNNKINFYDHFTHLLVHSFLHINGFMHKKKNDFTKMQKIEINILNKMGLHNPYILNDR